MSSLGLEARTSPNILEMSHDKRMMVVAGRASRDLGAKIASKLGVGLSDAGLKTFTDGEAYCRYAHEQGLHKSLLTPEELFTPHVDAGFRI